MTIYRILISVMTREPHRLSRVSGCVVGPIRIVRAREEAPIRTTGQLAKVVGSPGGWQRRRAGQKGGSVHPATRVFQVCSLTDRQTDGARDFQVHSLTVRQTDRRREGLPSALADCQTDTPTERETETDRLTDTPTDLPSV
jgi:hypothetical protein